MVTDMFGTLLQELGHTLGKIELHPDHNNSCLIHLKEGINIQLELDRAGMNIILGCNLGTVPPGKYRELLFHAALQANDLPHPLHGIFAFSKKTEHLILFEKINAHDLTGEKIAAEINPFVQKAVLWAEALKRNEVPAINSDHIAHRMGSGMFGMKP